MSKEHRNNFPLGDEKWPDYASYFNRIQLPAKAVLLKEGAISKKLFVIEKGCVRAWFNNNGKDVTFQFFFENSMVSSIESLRKKIPSPITIETLEPSVLWYVEKNNLDKIVAEITTITELREKFIDSVFERTFEYMKHFLSFIKDTPLQRYLHLIKEKPQIVKRIPQHYIASYLGISKVHLSRIKNKLTKKK